MHMAYRTTVVWTQRCLETASEGSSAYRHSIQMMAFSSMSNTGPEMLNFNGAPDLINSSNYGQLEWRSDARPYVRQTLLDEMAC
jgi:hypothetical protein